MLCRGPQGVWTMASQGKQARAKTSTIKACPTPSHMALRSLEKAGYLKFLISQVHFAQFLMTIKSGKVFF